MGLWHRPSQVAIILKKIQLDIPPRELYEYEASLGWTECCSFDTWIKNTKERILKLTGRSIYSYIKPYTINYRNMIDGRYNYEVKMAKKTKKLTDEERRKILDELDKEDILIINEAYRQRIEELEKEIAEQKKIKSKCITFYKIEAIYALNKRRMYKDKICKLLGISRRTLNDKLLKKNIFSERKIRSDCISASPLLCSLVNEAYEQSGGVYGQRRVHKTIIDKGYKYTLSTISNAMRSAYLYANEVKVKPKKYEDKNTKVNFDYLVGEDLINTYKPGEAFSIDFSQIETKYGKMWMHGARDIVTKKIEFLFLCEDQSKETVLKHYKSLPDTTKVINTDHGTSYLAYEVQDYLKQRNIKQSTGRVGCSYDNRWIEDFWKRIKYEWFSKYPTKNINSYEIEKNMKRYKWLHNYKRLTTINGLLVAPMEYEFFLYNQNGQFI